MSKRMGRPKLAASKLREIAVPVRMNAEEHKLFVEAASGQGLSLADWVRAQCWRTINGVRHESDRDP